MKYTFDDLSKEMDGAIFGSLPKWVGWLARQKYIPFKKVLGKIYAVRVINDMQKNRWIAYVGENKVFEKWVR